LPIDALEALRSCHDSVVAIAGEPSATAQRVPTSDELPWTTSDGYL
jgi:hypothetical protein